MQGREITLGHVVQNLAMPGGDEGMAESPGQPGNTSTWEHRIATALPSRAEAITGTRVLGRGNALQRFAAAGLLHCSLGPCWGPGDPLVPLPAASQPWPCAGPIPSPSASPWGSGARQGQGGLARTGVPTRCGHAGLTDWPPQPGLPWSSRRDSLSPSQNSMFLLLFCTFNYDFLWREALPEQHRLQWWSCC